VHTYLMATLVNNIKNHGSESCGQDHMPTIKMLAATTGVTLYILDSRNMPTMTVATLKTTFFFFATASNLYPSGHMQLFCCNVHVQLFTYVMLHLCCTHTVLFQLMANIY